MQIDVTFEPGAFADDTRAYAEFRLFLTLTRLDNRVAHATLDLRRAPRGNPITCTIDLALRDGTHARAGARGDHPHQAIDRATEDMDARVRPRVRGLSGAPVA